MVVDGKKKREALREAGGLLAIVLGSHLALVNLFVGTGVTYHRLRAGYTSQQIEQYNDSYPRLVDYALIPGRYVAYGADAVLDFRGSKPELRPSMDEKWEKRLHDGESDDKSVKSREWLFPQF